MTKAWLTSLMVAWSALLIPAWRENVLRAATETLQSRCRNMSVPFTSLHPGLNHELLYVSKLNWLCIMTVAQRHYLVICSPGSQRSTSAVIFSLWVFSDERVVCTLFLNLFVHISVTPAPRHSAGVSTDNLSFLTCANDWTQLVESMVGTKMRRRLATRVT